MLGTMMGAAFSIREIQHIDNPNVEKSIEIYVNILKRTRLNYFILTGKADPNVFENSLFIGTLEEKIYEGNKDFNFRLAFSKNKDNKNLDFKNIDEATEEFCRFNPNLARLKKEYPNKIKLDWLKFRMCNHFAVSNNIGIMIESSHLDGEPRAIYVNYNPVMMGSYFEHLYYKVIKTLGQELNL